MDNEIIPYIEMCRREGTSLQKGMNFGLGHDHSVILMSVRPGAPYEDRLEDGGDTLIYEGHDVNRTKTGPNPKTVDQPERHSSGTLTENGKFHEAAQLAKRGERPLERVRVYEKIKAGIWTYNGVSTSWTPGSNGQDGDMSLSFGWSQWKVTKISPAQ